MWGAAWDGPPEARWYVGVQVGADAAQEDGPDDFDLRDSQTMGRQLSGFAQSPFL